MVVVEGTGDAQLQDGPGHYPGTPLPGEAGNVAIAGHRTTYLHPFYNLDAARARRRHRDRHRAGAVRLPRHEQPGGRPDRRRRGRRDPDADPDPHHLQPPLQRQPAAGGPRGAGGRCAHPAKATAPTSPTSQPSPTATAIHRAAAVEQARNPGAAILWGIAVAALISGIWVLARRTRGRQRAAVLAGGLLAWLGVVFLFFQALSPLLPASY